MEITNSGTGEVMARAPRCKKEEVNQVVEADKKCFSGLVVNTGPAVS